MAGSGEELESSAHTRSTPASAYARDSSWLPTSRRSQLLEIERSCGLHARSAQERARTTTAIRHGLERNGAGWAARRPAVDASEVVKRLIDLVRATTGSHWCLRGTISL